MRFGPGRWPGRCVLKILSAQRLEGSSGALTGGEAAPDNALQLLQIDSSARCSQPCQMECGPPRTAGPRAFSPTSLVTQRDAGTGDGRSGQPHPSAP